MNTNIIYIGLLILIGLLTWYPIKRSQYIYCDVCKLETKHDTTDYPDERSIICSKCKTRTVTEFSDEGDEKTTVIKKDRTPKDRSGKLGRPPKKKKD